MEGEGEEHQGEEMAWKQALGALRTEMIPYCLQKGTGESCSPGSLRLLSETMHPYIIAPQPFS